MTRKPFVFLSFLAVLALLSGCIRDVQAVGYTLDDKALKEIIPGESTKEQVQAVLGSPSSISEFGQLTWYYISSEYERKAFLKPKLVSQSIVAVTFDEETVADVKRYSKDDAKAISMVKDTTPTEGHDMGIINQLLGNVGRFNTDSNRTPGSTRGGI